MSNRSTAGTCENCGQQATMTFAHEGKRFGLCCHAEMVTASNEARNKANGHSDSRSTWLTGTGATHV